MSEPNDNKNKTSSHWAVSEEDCENMAERNQWKMPILAHLYSKIKVFGT